MTTLLSIDPGMSTGISFWSFTADEPLERLGYWQVPDGLAGFLRWHEERVTPPNDWDSDPRSGFWYDDLNSTRMLDLVVVEKFIPRSGKRFSHTLSSVEPLRIEGAIVALGLTDDYSADSSQWQQPSQQYFCGGSGVKEKRKLSKEWLKTHGLYLTGSKVGKKDAEDVLSSTFHAFTYMRTIRHMPTLRKYFQDE